MSVLSFTIRRGCGSEMTGHLRHYHSVLKTFKASYPQQQMQLRSTVTRLSSARVSEQAHKFSLESYTESLINKLSVDHNYPVLSIVTPVKESATQASTMLGTECDIIVLVDLGARSWQDLDDSILKKLGRFEMWSKFINKYQSSGSFDSDITSDKFLQSFDVGDSSVQTVSCARMPLLMHEKLDLARRLAAAHAASMRSSSRSSSSIAPQSSTTTATSNSKHTPAAAVNKRGMLVAMLDSFGELTVDIDMADAIVSAVAMKQYSMPSFTAKRNSQQANVAATNQQGAAANDNLICNSDAVPVEIIVADDSVDSDGCLDSSSSSTTNSGSSSSSGSNTDNSITDSNSAVTGNSGSSDAGSDQADGGSDAAITARKVSALEAAMLQASRDNFGVDVNVSPNPETPGASQQQQQQQQNQQSSSSSSLLSSGLDTATKLKQRLEFIAAVNAGTQIARELASLPSNILNPASYFEVLKALSLSYGWEIKEWDSVQLKDTDTDSDSSNCDNDNNIDSC